MALGDSQNLDPAGEAGQLDKTPAVFAALVVDAECCTGAPGNSAWGSYWEAARAETCEGAGDGSPAVLCLSRNRALGEPLFCEIPDFSNFVWREHVELLSKGMTGEIII